MTDKRRTGGFASMDPERQRAISRRGGASVPADKRAFATNRALASEAGRRGGTASHRATRAQRLAAAGHDEP